jgi:hypothetical protein
VSPETRAPYAADVEPVEDLAVQAAFIDWLTAYRVIDPTVTPTAALRDAYLHAWYSALELDGEAT